MVHVSITDSLDHDSSSQTISPQHTEGMNQPRLSGQLTLTLPDARSESSSKSAKAESVKDIVTSNAAQCREALEQQQTSTFYLLAGGKRLG